MDRNGRWRKIAGNQNLTQKQFSLNRDCVKKSKFL